MKRKDFIYKEVEGENHYDWISFKELDELGVNVAAIESMNQRQLPHNIRSLFQVMSDVLQQQGLCLVNPLDLKKQVVEYLREHNKRYGAYSDLDVLGALALVLNVQIYLKKTCFKPDLGYRLFPSDEIKAGIEMEKINPGLGREATIELIVINNQYFNVRVPELACDIDEIALPLSRI